MHSNPLNKLLLLPIAIISFGITLTCDPTFGESQENQKMQLVVPPASAIASYQQQVDKLLYLMRQRLLLQNDVARWKWNHNSVIEAPEREQMLLEQLREQASTYGLAPDAVVVFFQWQIFAGKLLQVEEFQTWQREGIQFFDNVPDLNQTLRPSLDKLSPEILAALADISPSLSCSAVQQLIQSRAQVILRGDDIYQAVRHTAIAPLIELKGTSCPDVSQSHRAKN